MKPIGPWPPPPYPKANPMPLERIRYELACAEASLNQAEIDCERYSAQQRVYEARFGWLERDFPKLCSWFHLGRWEDVNVALWNRCAAESMENHVRIHRARIIELEEKLAELGVGPNGQ